MARTEGGPRTARPRASSGGSVCGGRDGRPVSPAGPDLCSPQEGARPRQPPSPAGSGGSSRAGWSYQLGLGEAARRHSWGSTSRDSNIDSARSSGSLWSDSRRSVGSSRVSAAWSEDSQGSAPPRRLPQRGTVLCGGPDDELQQDAGVRRLLRLRDGEPATIGALAALARRHAQVVLRMLLRLVRALAPGERPPHSESELPQRARRAVAAYGVSAGTVGGAAEALSSSSSAQLSRFVRDCLRVCDGVEARHGELSDRDLRTWVAVFDLAEVLAELPSPSPAPPRPLQERQKPPKVPEQKKRLSFASGHAGISEAEAARLGEGLGALMALRPGEDPSATSLAAALRRHPGLGEPFVLRVLSGLAPEGSKCARLASPDAPLPSAARKLLKSYGVSEAHTVADAAEGVAQSASAGRFVRDALRVCEGLSASAPERLEPGDLSLIVRIFGLADACRGPPCRGGCPTCWAATMTGGAGLEMRTRDEIEALTHEGAEGGAGTWAAQVLSAAPRDAPEHLKELRELERGGKAKKKKQKAGGPSPGAEEGISEGDEIVLLADADEVKRLIADVPRLGWQDEMQEYCGKRGAVKRLNDKDRKLGRVQIMHHDKNLWTWPLAACMKLPESLSFVPSSPLAAAQGEQAAGGADAAAAPAGRRLLPSLPPRPGSGGGTRDPQPTPLGKVIQVEEDQEEAVAVQFHGRRERSRNREKKRRREPASEREAAALPSSPAAAAGGPAPAALPQSEQERLEELRKALPTLLAPPPLPSAAPPPRTPPDAASGAPQPQQPPPVAPQRGGLRSCLKQPAPQPRRHRRPDGGSTRLRQGEAKEGGAIIMRHNERVMQLTHVPDPAGLVMVRTAAGDEGWMRAKHLHRDEGDADGAAAHAAAVLARPLGEALDADADFARLFRELAPDAQRGWTQAWGAKPTQPALLRHVTDCVRAGLWEDWPPGWRATARPLTRAGSDASSQAPSIASSARSCRSRVSFMIDREHPDSATGPGDY
eukprot:TRINITY_DN1342_c0_g1_i1.p1 TRINITY_DN1342_c0_g1~~TRINITY_DN1342_c0_g1_i1.p1  ORF type:complete len:995 (+),score=236.67 TRINITY_DN1342_c0_g1_i1:50-3034(+)